MKESEEKRTMVFINTIALVVITVTMILCALIKKDADETVAWFVATLWCFESLILNRKK